MVKHYYYTHFIGLERNPKKFEYISWVGCKGENQEFKKCAFFIEYNWFSSDSKLKCENCSLTVDEKFCLSKDRFWKPKIKDWKIEFRNPEY